MPDKRKKRVFASALVMSLIIPVLSTLLIGGATIITSSDIAYPEWVPEMLSFASSLVGRFCVFASCACAAAEILLGKGFFARILALLSPPLSYLASIIVDAGFYGFDALGSQYLMFTLTGALYEIARNAAVIVILVLFVKYSRRAGRTDEPEYFSLKGRSSCAAAISSAVIFVSLLIPCVIETCTLLSEYGAPQNTSETVTLVLPYPSTVIYSLLGYLLTCLIIRLILRDKTQSAADSK